jgi:hypothetical protein
MTTTGKAGDFGTVLGEWIGELRKELKDIRKKTETIPASVSGIESALRLRLETVETEAKLIEMYLSVITKSMEVMGQIAKG